MQALKSNESHLACPFFIIKMKNKMLYSSLFSTSKELEVLKRLPMPLTSTKTINITKNNQKKNQTRGRQKKAIKILLLIFDNSTHHVVLHVNCAT